MMSVCINAINFNGGNFSDFFDGIDKRAMFDLVPDWVFYYGELPWVWAMLGSILIGLSGVLPLLIIPIDEKNDLKQGESANTLKTLLSFAVGGLLGDVFLHSLPEIWANDAAKNGGIPSPYNGLLVLSGLMIFVIAEKLFSAIGKFTEKLEEPVSIQDEKMNNNVSSYELFEKKPPKVVKLKSITGYLNLVANMVDNFTHGLSVGGAFLVSLKLGFLTTFAILLHEIPHEVGDFAILLKSGFTRWDAAKGQIVTAGGGLLGSLVAIFCSGASNSIEARTSWILPLTSGTFLHIALVTVLPELLKEEDPVESFKQMCALIFGIAIMGFIGAAME